MQCDGRFTFSISRDSKIVGRRDRGGSINPLNDLVTNSELESWEEHDFGHYDVFNHFNRIDNSPYNFIIQGTPQSSYGYKVLSVIEGRSDTKTLSPIIQGNKPDDMDKSNNENGALDSILLFKKDGTHPPHAMENYFTYIEDDVGEGILGTGMYYQPNPFGERQGFLYRKPLFKDEHVWSHNVNAACSVMKQIPKRPIAIAAFLDGLVFVIRTDTGEIIHKNFCELNHLPNFVFSLDCSKDIVVFGTMTGEVLSMNEDTLLENGFTNLY